MKSLARRCIGLHACPCGYYGDPIKPCSCSSSTVTRYQKRISGPLLDRIDIHVEVPRVDYEKLSDDRFGEPSASVQARVESARELQRQRFQSNGGSQNTHKRQRLSSNSDMHPAEIRKYCELDITSQSLMRSAMSQMQLSARAYHRVLKLSRTIADLAGEAKITPQHLAEALQYRPKLGLFFFFLIVCASISALSTQTADIAPENEDLIPTTAGQITSINEEVDIYTRALHNRKESCISLRDTFDFTFDDDLIGHGVGA